ncbi:MAG: hypothetical protein ACREQZ_12405 [Woeseiaceae bacterium]
MHRNSSSISSSDGAGRQRIRRSLSTLGCMLLSLAVLDLAIGFVFGNPYGRDPERVVQLTRYFDYGRSIEGKVRAMAGADGSTAHPLAQAGWIAAPAGQPDRPGKDQDLLIAVYGMSFAANIVRRVQELDPRIAVRVAGGPAAALSHSYAMYMADRGRHEARVVVLGILASSLPGLVTTTHMTWNFEGPSPHFYPRFTVADGSLVEFRPSVATLPELQAILRDESRWQTLIGEIAANDEFYDPLVFNSWSLDGSIVARLARRGWGQKSKRATLERFHRGDGFTNELGLRDVAQALVSSFIVQVRNDGKLPVIVAINDRGYADHLHQILRPAVRDDLAVYLSTHELAPATDSGNFLKDGHFTPAKDRLVGRRLAALINARLDRR